MSEAPRTAQIERDVMVARAAFALAAIGERPPTDAELIRWIATFGAAAMNVALRVSDQLLIEESAALEAYTAIRAARNEAMR